MIRLESNKSALYQWDLNMRVILTNVPAGTEVHYSNANYNMDENCITVVSYSENGCVYADIPNKILQTSGVVLAYIYIQDEDKAWTEFETEILVLPRKKPADYVYTETEIKTFESLEKRIENLESTQDPDAIKNAVEDYIEQNPLEETDPTVPQWAKQSEKPTYTASEVGADASGTAESKVSEHNVSDAAHNDIRLLVQGLTERLSVLADSDDTTLDQMSEVVAYIKSNKSLIDAITTSKINVSDIIDNLTTNVSNKPLSAAQGVALKTMIDAITAVELDETLTDNTKAAPAGMVGGLKNEIDNIHIPEQVQPDWTQNDDTAADFVKNRPFYSETRNITVENAADVVLECFPVFAVGDTVTVNVDGVEHSLVAYDDGGSPAIGDTFESVNNGEGQLGWNIYVDEEVYFYARESHTVSYLGIDHHKIDLKYLPTQRVAFTKSEYNDGALSDTMSDGEVLDSVVLNIPVLKSPFLEGQIACSPDGSLFLRNQYARFGYFVTVTDAIEINSDTLTSETFELSIPDGDIYQLKVCDIYTKTQYYVLFPSMPGVFISTSVGFISNSFTQSVAYINGHLFAFCTSSLPVGQDRTITLTVKKIL